MTRLVRIAGLPVVAALAACTASSDATGFATRADQPSIIPAEDAPLNAAPGTCWVEITTPAVIETITQQTLIRPAEIAANGQVLRPAEYQSNVRQRITQEREALWIETPCPEEMTVERVATLQRALAARGYMPGPATGFLSTRTRSAIRAYQEDQGLTTSLLTRQTAEELGVIPVRATPAT